MATILKKSSVSLTFFLLIILLALAFAKLLNPSLYSSITTTPSNLVSLSFSIFAISLILPIVFKKPNLPPGPPSLPIFGNWLQVGSDLNHRFLASMSQRHGPLFLLKLGAMNMVVVSDPKLAEEVLHTQGVEFGSRPPNIVFDIFTDKGQDMVFSVYGDHWRKMRRVVTAPFFTSKVVQQYREMWEQEMDLVVKDLYRDERASVEGVVIRRRLQLMQYNILYGMMFGTRFESVGDPLFKQVTQFNTERTMLAQSFEYNYGEFMPFLRPFLRGYLERCRELQRRRLAFFNNYFIEKRRYLLKNFSPV